MDNIFEVKDKTGRIIYLSGERWKHIIVEHPSLANKIDDIKDTIVKPLIINQSKYRKNVQYYYKYYKDKKLYLMAIVKYLNGKGFIMTSFYVKNIEDER